MYSVDFEILRDQNLPNLLQTNAMQAFCSVLQSVVVRLHAEFTTFRLAKNIRLAHNGQVNSLTAILNDTFDNTQRRIQIVDVVIPEDYYIGCRLNLQQTYIASYSPLALPEDNFYIGNAPHYYGQYDFTVMIPNEIDDDQLLITNMVNEYKQAGKTFNIEILP